LKFSALSLGRVMKVLRKEFGILIPLIEINKISTCKKNINSKQKFSLFRYL